MLPIGRFLSVLVVAPLALATASTEPPTPPSADESPGLAEMAAMVPATSFELGSGAQLYYVDMSLAWERLGIGADTAEREERIGEFGSLEHYTILPQLVPRENRDFDASRAEVGFSTVEIERELAVRLPPDDVFIDVTSVSVDDIGAAVAADQTWSPQLTTIATEFGSYYSWGDGDERNLDLRSPLRPFGQGGQLAVLGDGTATTIRTLGTDEVEAALAAGAGAVDSAATSSVILGPVLDGLAGESVVQLVATSAPPMFDPGFVILTGAEVEEILEMGGFLQPYLGLAVAEIVAPDGMSTEILLVNLDAEDAATNAELVTEALDSGIDLNTRQPLSELLPGAEVSVDGNVVRVSLAEPSAFRIALRMLETRALFPTR